MLDTLDAALAHTLWRRPVQTQNIDPLRAEINILRRDQLAGKLSPCERLIVGYEIADAAAAVLAEGKSVSTGHRSAMYAHLMSLMLREGESHAQDFVSVLAGMVGLGTYQNGSQRESPPDDPTDWKATAIQ